MSAPEPPLTIRDAPTAAPPPSAALLAAVGDMRPRRPRAPSRDVVLVAAVALATAVAWIAWVGPRRDLPYLPREWLMATSLLWLAGFVAPLLAALLPPRGQVAVDARRALWIAVGSLALLLTVAVAWSPVANGHTVVPAATEQLPCVVHCLGYGTLMGAATLLAAALLLRRVVAAGAWRVGAAIGAASGALAGLILGVVCPIGGALHIGFGHGGAALVLAVLGALAGAATVRRR